MQDQLRRIAERVKGWRIDAGLTLQDVSESAGVSASTVHKIENLQTIPTISVLLKVANGLGRRPHELFDEATPGDGGAVLVRAESRESVETGAGSALQRVVGAIDDADIDLWHVTHAPGRGSRREPDAEPLAYRGELVIMVDVGRLHVTVGEDDYDLGPGDTLHFKTTTAHAWVNRTDAPASAYFFALLPESARRLA